MTEMLKRLARLPEDKRARLLAQLRAGAEPASNLGPAARQGTGPVPLSFNQEPLWTHHRLSPDEPTYSMPFCYRLRGELDVEALRGALTGLVARHESLRTSVTERDNTPVQVIAPEMPVEMLIVEASSEQEVESLLKIEARIPFTIETPPLWRIRLYRLASDDHYLLFNVHHMIFDGWSTTALVRDLAELYRAGKNGVEPDLAELPVQYADYSIWQREWLAGKRLEELNTWWRERLADAPTLEFPTDRPRPTQVTFNGAGMQTSLPPELDRAVDGLARKLGVTPFNIFTAGFAAMMQRYSGQDDVVIGSPNANRRFSSLETVTGFFINQLVLRFDLSGDPTFREVIDRTRTVVQDTFSHGDIPFGKLIEAVRPPRDPSRQPLFQIAFAVTDFAPPIQLEGIEVGIVGTHTGTSRFDMAWGLTRNGEQTTIECEYNTDLFDAETVERFAANYGQFLLNACATPQTPLSWIEALDEREYNRVLSFGDGPKREVRHNTITAEFEARVAERAGETALVVDEVPVTYAELNRRANRLAHHLIDLGAKPGQVVALALPRSADLVVSVLAVLKSGAAYLPLDPTNPSARIAQILGDADALAVLTDSSLSERVAEAGRQLVVLDEMGDKLNAAPDTDPQPTAGPDDVAYIIYTSGSTGQPKGVLIEQRSVVNFIDTVQELFELTPDDRVLGFASLNFDVSVFEIFSALLTGARLYLAVDEERLSIERLQALMERSGITVIDLPPAVMNLLEPERFDALRIVFVGGEAFSAELVNRWNPGRRLFNGYGPTECTVTMIVEECPGTWETTPPIGLPMTNHVAHVLDQHLNPVPCGVPGELVIGGEGLARGYLNRPELTEEKFVADPFGTAPGGRLYRTGDLVKRLSDGRIVFIGRIDQQVKIRGLRIELGEVEAGIATFPGVAQVAVEPWADAAGERHLVGYVSSGKDLLDMNALREHLAGRLPAYMIPSYFVDLPELPLNSSGKVNRRALPDPEPLAGSGPVAQPRTETERVLVQEIMGPLLRNERVGVGDDFFQLGGNSLQAAQLISSINRRFKVRISLADFFLSPTPAHIAGIVDSQRMDDMSEDELLTMLESMSEDEVNARLEGENR
ncbi:amino acid adenylation domain-containing protein [Sphaerisporangium sp. NPDC051011]|uniref:non-ribosomal peptide synthetase n=1 Tax=Sphaerisporangium sp. NPDC051011 TaxID=3155792 RepID=UPI0033E57D75